MAKYRNPTTGEIWDSETGEITPAPAPVSPQMQIVPSVDPRFTDDGVPIEEGFAMPAPVMPVQERPLMERLIGAGETALTLGTGAIGGTVGTAYGTAEGLLQAVREGKYGLPEGVEMAQEAALRRAGQMTYAPRTEAGQEYVADVAGTLAPLSTIPPLQAELGMLTTAARQAASMPRSLPGAPVAAPAAERIAAPVARLAKPVVQKVVETAKKLPQLLPDTEYKKLVADQLIAGKADKRLAKYMLVGSKAKKDPLYKEALKQGFDEGVIAAIKGASKEDKLIMRKMVNTMQRGKENALFAVKNRPTDVAGENLLKRFTYIRKVNETAASKLDATAKSLRGRQVDFSEPVNNFVQRLDDMGIQIGDDLVPVFAGSDIDGLPGPQSVVTNIIKRLAAGEKGKTPDAYDIHRLKRYIDENVTYGTAGEGLKGRTEGILKQLRREMDAVLDDNFPAYNKVNTAYSDTINAMDKLQDVAGRKMDLMGANADKAVGTLLRRLMSNAQSRVNLVDAVDELSSISAKYGGKFKDNLDVQMLLADEMDSVFGPVARSSLAGETAKAVRRGTELATGQRTMYGAATDVAEAGMERMRGINEQNAFNVLNQILSR